MTNYSIRAIATYTIQAARASGLEEHEVEEWATNSRIAEIAGGTLEGYECDNVRDAIATALS